MGKEDHDKNFKVYGNGPLTFLEVSPLSGKYFGDYLCRAENPHGSANHSIELIRAQEPTIIQQVCVLFISLSLLTFDAGRPGPGDLNDAPLQVRAANQHGRAAP